VFFTAPTSQSGNHPAGAAITSKEVSRVG